MKKRIVILVSILAVVLLVSLAAPQATAKQTSSLFEATFTGEFRIAGDVGKSVLFVVEESHIGEELTLGAFTYTAFLLHNVARIPPDCYPGSSTGVDGSAVLTFGDDQIRLKRISGTACFEFPTVEIEEQWVIASGTGNYRGATGKLSRQLDGDVGSWTAVGTINGTIRFRD